MGEMAFDYGLTALGSRFHMDWRHQGTDPRALVRRWAELAGSDDDGLEELRGVRDDVQLLLASPLSDEEIHVLWRTVATYYPEEGTTGRSWLLDIDAFQRDHRPA